MEGPWDRQWQAASGSSEDHSPKTIRPILPATSEFGGGGGEGRGRPVLGENTASGQRTRLTQSHTLTHGNGWCVF